MGFAKCSPLKDFFFTIVLAYRSKNVVQVSAPGRNPLPPSPPIFPLTAIPFKIEIFPLCNMYVKCGYANFHPLKEFSSRIIRSAYRSKNMVFPPIFPSQQFTLR